MLQNCGNACGATSRMKFINTAIWDPNYGLKHSFKAIWKRCIVVKYILEENVKFEFENFWLVGKSKQNLMPKWPESPKKVKNFKWAIEHIKDNIIQNKSSALKLSNGCAKNLQMGQVSTPAEQETHSCPIMSMIANCFPLFALQCIHSTFQIPICFIHSLIYLGTVQTYILAVKSAFWALLTTLHPSTCRLHHVSIPGLTCFQEPMCAFGLLTKIYSTLLHVKTPRWTARSCHDKNQTQN